MTTNTKNANRRWTSEAHSRIDELTAEAERCLAELRALPRTRKHAARRVFTQARYADLGEEMRQTLGMR